MSSLVAAIAPFIASTASGSVGTLVTSLVTGLPGQVAGAFFAVLLKLPFVSKAFFVLVVFWALFLAYVALHAAQRNGKLAATPIYVRVLSYTLVAIMWTFDVVFNLTVGTLIFVELPSTKALTFTARCEVHLDDTNFRGGIARWVCNGWLNPFEAGHCQAK